MGCLPLVLLQVLGLDAAEPITAMLPVQAFSDDRYLVMTTIRGDIKRTPLSAFATRAERRQGTTAIKMKEGDSLCAAQICEGGSSVLLASSSGQVLHMMLQDTVRCVSKTASTVKVSSITGLRCALFWEVLCLSPC